MAQVIAGIVNYIALPGLKNAEKIEFRKEKELGKLIEFLLHYGNDVLNYKCNFKMFVSRSRNRTLTTLRHTFCYVNSRNKYFSTLVQCGKFLGGRDHTTVIHSIQLYQDMVDIKDPIFLDIHKQLKENNFI